MSLLLLVILIGGTIKVLCINQNNFFLNRKLDDLAWIAVFKELDVSQDEFLHGLRCVRVESHDIQHHGVVWIRNGEVIAGHAADN